MPPATLRALSARGVEGAWDALVTACAPPVFSARDLDLAKSAYPAPRGRVVSSDPRKRRSGLQTALSGSWGRDERYRADRPAFLTPADSAIILEVTGRHVSPRPLTLGAPAVAGHTVSGGEGKGIRPGLTFTLTLAPGVAALSVTDRVRAERSLEATTKALRATSSAAAAFILEDGSVPERVPSRVITEWSRRSRSRMVRKFASVDWTDLADEGPLGMVTLTYPGDWMRVAPNGRTVKRHLSALRKRYARALGRPMRGAWKLEFQSPRDFDLDDPRRDGPSQGFEAPHIHALIPCPATIDGLTLEAWLAWNWADIVCRALPSAAQASYRASSEFSLHLKAGTGVDFAKTARMSDPKRLAVYFLGHSAKTTDGKEYQHNVPASWLCDPVTGELDPTTGPGRFWGFWGMTVAETALELDLEDFVTAKRILRRVAAARARSTAWSRARHTMSAHTALSATSGKASRALRSSRLVGGFVIVNDGTRLAADLARAINLARVNKTDL